MNPSPSTDNKLVRQQLSEGFEHLLYLLAQGQLKPDEQGFHCDVLIIGSGYGGAVAAAQLSKQATGLPTEARIWLLERGQAYQPGDFPDRTATLANHIRFSTPQQEKPRGNRMGLFDIRLGPDLQAVVGNGLGGGSLINAGVMIWPSVAVMQDAMWPKAIRQDAKNLLAWQQELIQTLGAQPYPRTQADATPLNKHQGLRGLAGQQNFVS
ncbi:MAG: GMC family oxidoreductase, partial [Burkholderiales bacterium]|nr:GMC family oxidoreductase [Burkholderiales bacterium]